MPISRLNTHTQAAGLSCLPAAEIAGEQFHVVAVGVGEVDATPTSTVLVDLTRQVAIGFGMVGDPPGDDSGECGVEGFLADQEGVVLRGRIGQAHVGGVHVVQRGAVVEGDGQEPGPATAFRRGRIVGPPQMAAVADAAAGIVELDDPDLLMAAGGMAFGVERPALARQLRHRAATLARARGELGTLCTALDVLVPDHLGRAQYAYAQGSSEEGHGLAVRAGRENTACSHLSYLTALAALRGDEDAAHRLSESVLAAALPRRLLRPTGVVQHALGLMELAAGRLEEALTSFEALLGHTPQPGRPELAMTGAPDHIEVAVRAGHADRVRDMASAYIELADAAGTAEVGALAARCRALLGAETEFPHALRLHAQADRPFDHARTQLLYGEYLRRRRQRVRAREHLRAAERTFTHLGLPVWARRAGEELRAAGATPRTRVTAGALTPQEHQIARAVAAGATNRQVAAKLFLSPRTVDYHLRKIFAKLGISSRAELIRNPPADLSG